MMAVCIPIKKTNKDTRRVRVQVGIHPCTTCRAHVDELITFLGFQALLLMRQGRLVTVCCSGGNHIHVAPIDEKWHPIHEC